MQRRVSPMFLLAARIAEQRAKMQAASAADDRPIAAALVKCTAQYVQNAAKRPKCLSYRAATSRSTVRNASRINGTAPAAAAVAGNRRYRYIIL